MGNPSQSYRASPAVWDHTLLPATRKTQLGELTGKEVKGEGRENRERGAEGGEGKRRKGKKKNKRGGRGKGKEKGEKDSKGIGLELRKVLIRPCLCLCV